MDKRVCFQYREGDEVYSFHTIDERHYVTDNKDKVTCEICLKFIQLCTDAFGDNAIDILKGKGVK